MIALLDLVGDVTAVQRLRAMARDARRDAWSDWLVDASPSAFSYAEQEAVASEWNADALALDEAADALELVERLDELAAGGASSIVLVARASGHGVRAENIQGSSREYVLARMWVTLRLQLELGRARAKGATS